MTPFFSDAFIADLDRLFQWRRDVRAFKPDPIPEALIEAILAAGGEAPSVGLSEPWRMVRVDGADARRAVRENFADVNARALEGYSGERAALYASLKLAGLDNAPLQLAVLTDEADDKGAGLGQPTMPETRQYSAVCAIMLMWLAARARGVGLGWVSILDPERLRTDLDLPTDWRLIGYLCLGWPEADSDTAELEKAGWETRARMGERVVQR